MYSPLATASSTSPAVNSATRAQIASRFGMSHSPSSMLGPMTRMFNTVPSPGRWRRGIHSASTISPMMLVSHPMPTPVWFDTPWAKTVHGSTPTAAAIIVASARP
ncbi:MAG: hypothetical protein ACTMIR_06955 [Cellulomonadaceae bacterium]